MNCTMKVKLRCVPGGSLADIDTTVQKTAEQENIFMAK